MELHGTLRMYNLLTILLLLSFTVRGQINIKSLGARETYADNAKYIQKAIDSAIKSGKYVYIPKGQWKSGPLVACNWNGESYRFFTVKIIGESTFWDMGDGSVIISIDPTAPALSIQKGKGCIVDGIQFMGLWKPPYSPYNTDINIYKDPNTRDSRYSPYCAIAIDPFCFFLPPDGGYPTLQKYYRGDESHGGSTGFIIKNCIFRGFTVGAITSPNGYTLNAELMTFENIQITDCKIGFAGCQAQEKMNRIINVGAWGTTHTLFCFNTYGEQRPGNWIIDGVNVAGDVNQIIHRYSGGYFPMYITHLYAETIFRIGVWQTFVGDQLSNSVIDFKDNLGVLPASHIEGGGVTISSSLIRYYGQDWPIVFFGGKTSEKGWFTLNDVKTTESLAVDPTYLKTYQHELPEGCNNSDIISAEVKDGQFTGNVKKGTTAVFLTPDNGFLGWAMLNGNQIKFKSSNIIDGNYSVIIK